ncbi:IclR family transcriptional regulator [Haladaptatus sp. NG-SE-30]
MTNSPEEGSSTKEDQVKSVSTLFSILERLKDNNGMGVTELAREMNMSKGAIHRYLRTLVNEGYAVNRDSTYVLGKRFLDFGAHVRNGYPYNEYIEPKVIQLAEQTGERAQYIVEEHGLGIYLHRERGQNAVQTDARIGKVVHLHTTAAGKAILSLQPRDHVDKIVNTHGLPERTDRTITDPNPLHEELAEIRERGYALNQEEHANGLYAVGVPITYSEGEVLGGLSVSGPAHRIKDRVEDETIPRTLLGIANEIELNLNYS